MVNIFYLKATRKVLYELYNQQRKRNISRISKKVGMTHAHSTLVTQRLRRLGLIECESNEREKLISLTELGVRITEQLKEFDDFLEEIDKLDEKAREDGS